MVHGAPAAGDEDDLKRIEATFDNIERELEQVDGADPGYRFHVYM